MKELLANTAIALLSKNDELKKYTKSNYYNETNTILSELEELVCGIISDTWCYFDENPKSKKELNNKYKEINDKYLKLIYYRDTHKSKLSKGMLTILGKIEVELYNEKQSINSLFFIKSDILDNLEDEFISQIKKDRKIIEKGKRL